MGLLFSLGQYLAAFTASFSSLATGSVFVAGAWAFYTLRKKPIPPQVQVAIAVSAFFFAGFFIWNDANTNLESEKESSNRLLASDAEITRANIRLRGDLADAQQATMRAQQDAHEALTKLQEARTAQDNQRDVSTQSKIDDLEAKISSLPRPNTEPRVAQPPNAAIGDSETPGAQPPAALSGIWRGTYRCGVSVGGLQWSVDASRSTITVVEHFNRFFQGVVQYAGEWRGGALHLTVQQGPLSYTVVAYLSADGTTLVGHYFNHQSCDRIQLSKVGAGRF